jgi:hypothetical protein
MSVWQYVAPWMSPGTAPAPAAPPPARIAPTPHIPKLVDDPTFCCAECEELTALIGAARHSATDQAALDAAVAARTCTRSPIGAP